MTKTSLFDFITTSITHELFNRVVKWNYERNKLEFDASLEDALITEEVKEFVEAKTTIDRFDAYLDTIFVGIGTIAKSSYMGALNTEKGIDGWEGIEVDYFYGMPFFHVMTKQMIGELEEFGIPQGEFINILNEGLKIVLEANEAKGKEKKKNGKISKPKNFIPPEKKLEALLKSVKYEIEQSRDVMHKAAEGGISNE